MSFTLIFEKDGNKSQSIEIPISPENMTEGSKNFKVVLSFINYTNGQAVSNQDKERIHLGDDAQVTIYSHIPTSETMKMETVQNGTLPYYFNYVLVTIVTTIDFPTIQVMKMDSTQIGMLLYFNAL